MACYVPFNSRNLDISFFVFKPTVVYIDDLVGALQQFSLYTGSLGCVHSSVFRSIHGNMIVWYGAWLKRTSENKQMLNDAILSMLTNIASMAILTEHTFFDAFIGESKDGSPAAKFFTGDIISMNSTTLSTNDDSNKKNISVTCLALFKDRFAKMDGAQAGICFRSQTTTRAVGLYVWKSLQHCYSYIINSDFRKNILPYLDGFSTLDLDVKYDIFRVVYVSGDSVIKVPLYPQHKMMENEIENSEGYPVVADFKER